MTNLPAEPAAEAAPETALRRRYFAWSRRVYARYAQRGVTPDVAVQAEALDRFLYSRAAVGAWLGAAFAVAGAALALHANGASWWVAVPLSVFGVFAMVAALASGWLWPHRYSAAKLWKIAGLIVVVTFAGRMGTLFANGELAGKSGAQWVETALALLWDATPFQLLAGLAMVLLVWVSSAARRETLKRELAQSRAEQERDAAAAQLTQARLSLLQAQIQPHFLFNTLAALQHWVDVGDARAAPLLRALTGFLRGSTELMLQGEVTLGEEAALVRHYLAIMQSRLGERLRFTLEIAPEAEAQPLPPGLLITLVENAVEHGIEPQLRGGEVWVIARRDADGTFELGVLDDGAGLAPGVPEGVGLTNSRERLQHRFGTGATLTLAARTDGPGTAVQLRIDAPRAPSPAT